MTVATVKHKSVVSEAQCVCVSDLIRDVHAANKPRTKSMESSI